MCSPDTIKDGALPEQSSCDETRPGSTKEQENTYRGESQCLRPGSEIRFIANVVPHPVAAVRIINTAMISYDSSYPTVGVRRRFVEFGRLMHGLDRAHIDIRLPDRFDVDCGYQKRIQLQGSSLGQHTSRSLLRLREPTDLEQGGRTFFLLHSGCCRARCRHICCQHLRRHRNTAPVRLGVRPRLGGPGNLPATVPRRLRKNIPTGT
jgi:hypothetical protein